MRESSNNSIRILCAEPQNYSEKALKKAARLGQLDAVEMSQEEFRRQALNYETLMVRLKLRVTGDIIASASGLKAIISPTTGLDHVDLQAAQSHDVAVFSLKDETEFLRGVYSTAEHTFALLLSLVRNIPMAAEAVKQYRWQQHQHRGHDLHGKTLGIVGCGRIGTMVAGYGHAFGMRVLGYDPYTTQLPKHVHRCDSLNALLRESQVISIHVPLNEATERMIGADELRLLPGGAFLINTSRGAVLDEDALLESLEQGHLAGAALDVLTDEHLIATREHALIEYARTHANLIITPHISGASQEAIEKTDMFVLQKFQEWMKEKALVSEIR
jgi:D-3-phosphoglycerate dehydrogenase